jgi:hypothetical protein
LGASATDPHHVGVLEDHAILHAFPPISTERFVKNDNITASCIEFQRLTAIGA